MLIIPLFLTLWISASEGSPSNFEHNVFLNKNNQNYLQVQSITTKPNTNHNPFLNGQFSMSQASQNSHYNFFGKDYETLVRTNPFFANHIPNLDVRGKPTTVGSIDTNPFLNHDKSEKTVQEVCGLSTTPLIRGGQVVQPGEYPWLGALFYVEEHDELIYICTVNLVTRQHLLTAAHCVTHDLTVEKYRVIMGYLSKDKQNNVKIKGIETHPEVKAASPSHDLAILVLENPISFTTSLKPICLWSTASQSSRTSRLGVVAGFGPDYSECRKIKFPMVSQDRCRASHVDFHLTTSDYTFCAGTRDNHGPCFGDSGAGYMQNETGRTHLRGVVSYSLSSNGDCNLREYVIFADVTKDLNWVHEKLKGHL